jgi:endonuclease/exonuclease/phosphatase (EEP) superfamily protein YafD
LALLVLCSANLALVVAIAGSLGAVSDIFAPLTGHLVGLGLAASAALLTRRLSALILGSLATLAVHAWLGLASCCHPPQTPAVAAMGLSKIAADGAVHDHPHHLSVLALNAWAGQDPRLAAYLAQSNVDLIVLSQVTPGQRAIEPLKQTHPYQAGCGAERACALALLARAPFRSAGTARIGDLAFVWARLAGGVTAIGTELAEPSRDPWRHERQMVELVQFIARIPGPVILAGDLKTTPWSKTYRTLRRVAGLVPANRLRPTWPAWPVPFPQLALDHIFVSADLGITAAGTGPAVGSDHLPVWASLQRRPTFDRGKAAIRGFASGPAPPLHHLGSQLLADLGGEHAGARNLRR